MEKHHTVMPGTAVLVVYRSPNAADRLDVDYSVEFDCKPEMTRMSPLIRCGQPLRIPANKSVLLWLPGAYRFTDNGIGSRAARIQVVDIPDFRLRFGIAGACLGG